MYIAVTSSGYGYIHRGIENIVENVVSNLSHEHKVDIFGIGNDRNCINVHGFRRDQAFAQFLSARWVRYLEHGIFAARAIRKIAQNSYDIIWCNDGEAAMPFFVYLRKKKSIPIVATGHGGGTSDLLIAAQKPDVLVVNKKESFDSVKNKFPHLPVTIIPNGVDFKFIDSITGDEFSNVSYERPIFLSTSAFVPFKRLDLLIKAVAQLKQGTLIMIGTGPLTAKLRKLGDDLLGNRFVMLGEKSHDEVLRWYKLADVFSLPSHNENYSLALLEALASNCPVVTQKDSYRERLVGDGGLVVDCVNISDYAQSLQHAAQIDWGDKPRNRVLGMDWQRIAKQYEQLFHLILEENDIPAHIF